MASSRSASGMWSVWSREHLPGLDTVEVFAGGLIAYTAERRSPEALMVLRALGAVAPDPYGSRARLAADRLAGAGVADPSWADLLGLATPTSACFMFDRVDNDGASVMIGFDSPVGAHTLGIYINHNLGGLAEGAYVAPVPIEAALEPPSDDEIAARLEYRHIPVAEAAARWRDALEITAMTVDPPVDQDMLDLGALLMARLSTMAPTGKVPQQDEIGPEERGRLIRDFLQSDEAIGLRDNDDGDDQDEDVEYLALHAMTFSLDYVGGTPLRFSPAMVEVFCRDFAPGQIPALEATFILLPDVLAAWIRFVGRRRAIPESSIDEAVEAVYDCEPEMIALCRDPDNWGPAKAFCLAMQHQGVDMSDEAAVDAFIADVNRGEGIDQLAQSLVETGTPTR
jgi:hypothetical protein